MELFQPIFQTIFHARGMLPSLLLILFFYLLLQAARSSAWRLALLALPGTLAHELAHFVVGLFLLAQPTRFSVWPKRTGNRLTLGAVTFRNINLLNGMFVALAPLLLLPLAWFCLRYFAIPYWNQNIFGGWLLCSYLIAATLLAALPSLPDIKLGAPSLMLYLGLVALYLIFRHTL